MRGSPHMEKIRQKKVWQPTLNMSNVECQSRSNHETIEDICVTFAHKKWDNSSQKRVIYDKGGVYLQKQW